MGGKKGGVRRIGLGKNLQGARYSNTARAIPIHTRCSLLAYPEGSLRSFRELAASRIRPSISSLPCKGLRNVDFDASDLPAIGEKSGCNELCLLDDSAIYPRFVVFLVERYDKRILLFSFFFLVSSIFSHDLFYGKSPFQIAVSTTWKNQSHCAKRLVLQKVTWLESGKKRFDCSPCPFRILQENRILWSEKSAVKKIVRLPRNHANCNVNRLQKRKLAVYCIYIIILLKKKIKLFSCAIIISVYILRKT